MTIDEAIAKYKEITNTDANCPAHCNISCDKCVQESEQLVEWLEELKDYRDKNKMVVRIDCVKSEEFTDIAVKLAKEQYNKAIDDFAEKLKSECREHYIDCDPYFGGITDSILYEDDIEEIAEQLKAGGENESV